MKQINKLTSTILIFLLSFNISVSQDLIKKKNETNDQLFEEELKNAEKWILRLEIDIKKKSAKQHQKIIQTAFKIKGKKGFFTSLHGFYMVNALSDDKRLPNLVTSLSNNFFKFQNIKITNLSFDENLDLLYFEIDEKNPLLNDPRINGSLKLTELVNEKNGFAIGNKREGVPKSVDNNVYHYYLGEELQELSFNYRKINPSLLFKNINLDDPIFKKTICLELINVFNSYKKPLKVIDLNSTIKKGFSGTPIGLCYKGPEIFGVVSFSLETPYAIYFDKEILNTLISKKYSKSLDRVRIKNAQSLIKKSCYNSLSVYSVKNKLRHNTTKLLKTMPHHEENLNLGRTTNIFKKTAIRKTGWFISKIKKNYDSYLKNYIYFSRKEEENNASVYLNELIYINNYLEDERNIKTMLKFKKKYPTEYYFVNCLESLNKVIFKEDTENSKVELEINKQFLAKSIYTFDTYDFDFYDDFIVEIIDSVLLVKPPEKIPIKFLETSKIKPPPPSNSKKINVDSTLLAIRISNLKDFFYKNKLFFIQNNIAINFDSLLQHKDSFITTRISFGQVNEKIQGFYYLDNFKPGDFTLNERFGSTQAFAYTLKILLDSLNQFLDKNNSDIFFIGHADGIPYRGIMLDNDDRLGSIDNDSISNFLGQELYFKTNFLNMTKTDVQKTNKKLKASIFLGTFNKLRKGNENEDRNSALAYKRAKYLFMNLNDLSNLQNYNNVNFKYRVVYHPQPEGRFRKVEAILNLKIKNIK